jgi:hypothetical protein
VAAYFLGLGMRGAEILGVTCSLAFSLVVLLYFRKLFPDDPLLALLGSVAVAASLIVQWGIFRPFFFDGVGYLLEACALYSTNPLSIALFTAAGGLSDERVITAVPLMYLVHVRGLAASLQFRTLFRPNGRQIGLITGVVLFLLARILLALKAGAALDASGIGHSIFRMNAMLLPLAVLQVYKGSMLLLAGGITRLARLGASMPLIAMLMAAAPGIAASVLVWDLNRSLAYTFPALFLSFRVLAESGGISEVRSLALRGAALSAFLPTYYVWSNVVYHLPIAGPFFWIR